MKKEQKGPGIFSLLKSYWGLIAMLLLFTLAGNAFNLWIPKLISQNIDAFSRQQFSYSNVIRDFLIATVCIFVFSYLQSIIQTYVSERVAKELRSRLSDKLSKQSYSFIETSNPSRLLTNMTADVDSIKMFISQAIVSIVSSLFIIVGASVLLISIDWKLALCVIAIVPVIGITFFLVLRKVRALFKQSREVIDWLNKVINESILGAAIIRVVNSQQLEYNKFLDANTKAKNLGLSILRLFATLIPVITFASNMAALSILAFGGRFVINGDMTLGNFAAFNSYLAMLIFPILIIGFMSNVIAQATASYDRISNILATPEPKEIGSIKNALQGNIEVQNVSLYYGQSPVLKDVSFQINPNTRTAIIGPTAAGKTQLLYLLTGLAKPSSGSIEYDNHTIEDYNSEAFYNSIGFVFQDSVLFNTTIRENIAFSDTVTDEALGKAIDTAELSEFVQTLPEGLDTIVSERGTSLSGGQKQRIMLARALATNPSVLLLDDFTARVDNNTEEKILENIQRNYPKLTSIAVTQKIASVEHYDEILLLTEGELVARGTHEQLMQTSPDYIQLYQSQQSTNRYELQS